MRVRGWWWKTKSIQRSWMVRDAANREVKQKREQCGRAGPGIHCSALNLVLRWLATAARAPPRQQQ